MGRWPGGTGWPCEVVDPGFAGERQRAGEGHGLDARKLMESGESAIGEGELGGFGFVGM